MLNRKQKKRIKNFSIVVIIIIVICLFFTIYRSYVNIRTAQYYERTAHLSILMEKNAQAVEARLTSTFDKINFIASRLQIRAHELLKTPQENLSNFETSLMASSGLALFLIDSDGIAYNSQGNTSDYIKDFINNNYENDIFVTPDPIFDDEISLIESREELIHLIKKFDTPLFSGGKYFTHIGLISPISIITNQLTIPAYKDKSYVLLLDSSDTVFYANENNFNSYLKTFFFERLKKAKFNYGFSYEQFTENLKNRVNSSFNVIYQNESYYLNHIYLEGEGWTIIELVPDSIVGVGSAFLTKKIIINFLIVSLMATLIILFVALQYFWHENRRKLSVQEQLKKLAEAEHAANKAKTNFLSSMSHDIRTPMNAIIGMTDIALQKTTDSNYMITCLKKIKKSSNHLLMLINDILDISKIESGNMVLNQVPFSLADTLERINNIAKSLIKEKGIDFKIRTQNIQNESFIGDELRLSQVYINLLTNAIKYTEYGGSVTIDIEEIEAENPDFSLLTYRIKDTGIGMSEEYQQQMFDSFSRATDSRVNKIQGTGLGLAICKKILTLMNGTITCDSKIGKGTTFTVTVELQNYFTEEDYTLDNVKVLIADDDSVFIDTALPLFESMQIEADGVFTGEDAISKIEKSFDENEPYSVVFIDQKMPKMDGIETTKQIRQKFGNDITIILLTAYDVTEFESAALSAGANTVMTKPLFKSNIYKIISKSNNTGTNSETQTTNELYENLSAIKLLVAEDNDMNWEIIETMLALKGIKTSRAENGQQCLDMLNASSPNEYSLVLMDVRMPIMDGITATQEIRKSNINWIKNIPIIAMTADAFTEDIQMCLNAGMNDHMAKPVDLELLLKKITTIHGGGYNKKTF